MGPTISEISPEKLNLARSILWSAIVKCSTRIVLALVVFCMLIGILPISVAPPRAEILSTMRALRRRIIRYMRAHDEKPLSLAALPRLDGYTDSMVDGWGRPIALTYEKDILILTSYGADGRKGGANENKDIIRSIWLERKEGRWLFSELYSYPKPE